MRVLLGLLALVLLANGQEVKTVMEFSRELNTCDAEGDQPILEQGTTRMVYAWNDQVPVDDNQIVYHSNRGTQSLNLVSQNTDIPQMPDDLRSTDLLVHDVLVNDSFGRPVDTIYYCQTFELPRDRKRHIVAIEPIVDPRAFEHVHHFLVFLCTDDLGPHVGWEGSCFEPGRPSVIDSCGGSSILTGWAVGGTTDYLPVDVGFPMGPGHAQHVLLQVHYDNPLLRPGIIDSSGMRLHYTDQLREHDGGVLQSGMSTGAILIPPGEEFFTVTGYCSADCTSYLPPEGVQIFSSVLHAHLAGVDMKVQHIRNGVELALMQNDPNYDFNFQTSMAIPNITLLPGDELITTCAYNTQDRTEVTRGGAATSDEMCFSYLNYYPLTPVLFRCLSTPRDGDHFQSCPPANGRQFTPQSYAPRVDVDACLDYEKPDLDREPHRLLEFNPSRFEHTAVMDPDGRYVLHWTYERALGVIHFAAEAPTTGWAGIGVSPNGGMVDSDVFIGWQDADGEVHFADRRAYAQALPPVDLSQDLYNIRIGKFLVPERSFDQDVDYKPLD